MTLFFPRAACAGAGILLSVWAINDAFAQHHVIGWQTFQNRTAGNNNSGVQDDTPDTNSTFDPTPVGSSSGNVYLTGSIGTNASSSGWGGLGQATNNDFLNGPTFGDALTISEYTLADGSDGTRIGPFGNPSPNGEVNGGTSSWKFGEADTPNQLRGDFSVTNHSDFHFSLEYIHLDARGLANTATSADTLTIRYLATPGELIAANTGLEIEDLEVISTITWAERRTENLTIDLATALGSEVRIPPGQKAAFRLVWSGNAGAGQVQVDNLAFSGTFQDENGGFVPIDPLTAPPVGLEGPNIIVIITDDQRWDATSQMQATIGATGRIARFPWLASPTKRTPNLDRLTHEGVHFNNAFVVYSVCSPSRATMLTGQYPHLHGVTDNFTDFPETATTYATLLQEAGYATGYFGKWHMGEQKARPGFSQAVTFHGQGTYFETEYFDESGGELFTSSATDWVDDVSTSHALDFITAQNAADRPFMMVLGFKTPHQPWEPPERNSELFASETAVSTPNLTVPPPFAPGANGGGSVTELRSYMRTIVGIDKNVGDVLDRLDDLEITNETAVIFISDNGFFRGEHRLGDKRSAYEESLRVPFMIRYPEMQNGPRKVDQMALNLDMAPTILEIAGIDIPETMQGRSLLPIIQGEEPQDWRKSFIFSYTLDPEFPDAAVVPHVGLRRSDGLKLVHYSDDARWNELYDTRRGFDPYEIQNLISSPPYANQLFSLNQELVEMSARFGFMKVTQNSPTLQGGEFTLQLADASVFQMQNSEDLLNWDITGTFEGGGTETLFSLINAEPSSVIVVPGDEADYVLAEGPPVSAVQGFTSLRAGSMNPAGGRNAVLVFELPEISAPQQIALAEIEVNVTRTFAQWDADLWVLGVKDNTAPILEYSEKPSGSAEVIKLEDSIFDFMTSNAGEVVKSNPVSGLTAYLQTFYQANPDYDGGTYIFLRVNPTGDIGVNEQRYTILAAEHADEAKRPKLKIHLKSPDDNPPQQFYRVRYGQGIAE